MLITAGPTIEPIDAVRFMSNRSTGLMGYELARRAKERKYAVTLITGPVSLRPPRGVRVIKIESASELRARVLAELKKNDALVMASAVSDFRPRKITARKIKAKKRLSLSFSKNRDILASIPAALRKNRIMAGFSLETENLLKNAAVKLKKKKLDLIVANKCAKGNAPFGGGRKTVYILGPSGTLKKIKNATKSRIAGVILDTIEELCYTRFI